MAEVEQGWRQRLMSWFHGVRPTDDRVLFGLVYLPLFVFTRVCPVKIALQGREPESKLVIICVRGGRSFNIVSHFMVPVFWPGI